MNPLAVSALSSLIIWILTFGSGWLVNHGIWTKADAATYVSAAAMGLISLAWAQRNVIKNRVKLLVALMPGIHTEDAVNAHIADKLPTPSLTTPSSTSPGVPGAGVGNIDPKRFVGPGAAVLLAALLGGGMLSVGVTTSGCASLPLKQQAVVSLQASETALEAAHDAERALCSPTADQTHAIMHCDGATAQAIGLTDAKHRQIAQLFAVAFTGEIQAATALKAWQAGQPAPTTVSAYRADLDAILAVVGQIVPKTETTAAQLQQAIDQVAGMLTTMGVK